MTARTQSSRWARRTIAGIVYGGVPAAVLVAVFVVATSLAGRWS